MNPICSLKNTATALCIFMTGAAAMMYQVTWQRYLARLLGGDAVATAVVLAAFLGGLSLGYGAFGGLSARIKQPWKAYAWAEVFIGLWGLAFPTIFSIVQSTASGLSLAPPWLMIFQGFALAVVLIGPPTICMGATVPLLTQALSRTVESSGRVHALLYGVNTAGAFLGAILAGYLTIPSLGLPGTLTLSAVLNLLAAGWFACTQPAPATASPQPYSPLNASLPPADRGLIITLMALALVNGFQTMALENVLVRFVALSVGGSVYAFTMVVGVFVLAIAVGALSAARASANAARVLWLNQVLIAVSLVAVYPTLDTWPYWAHRLRLLFPPDNAGFWGFQAAGFVSLTLVIAIPATCIGAAIPLIFSRLRSNLATVGNLSGRILCVNTIGNLAGSLVAGLLLHPLMNNGQIFLLCVVLALMGAWLAAHGLAPSIRIASGLVALAGVALLPAAPFYTPERFVLGTFRIPFPLPFSSAHPREFYREFLNDFQTLFQEDGPEASAAVVRTPRLPWSPEAPLAILVNGKSDSSTVSDMATLKLLAHLPALLAPSHSRALVIGLGTGVTSAELALYPDTTRIDTAEISSSVIKALPLFSSFTNALHLDPRHKVIHGDAFRVLARSDMLWDIIVSEPSNPWVLGVDALFSKEFYRLAKQHLTSGGLFVQWIHIHNASAQMLGSVLTTLNTEFPHLRVFMSQANDLVLLASLIPLPDSALTGASRILTANPKVAGSLNQAGIPSLEALLSREMALPQLTGPIETLDRPVLHYMAGKSYFKGDSLATPLLLAGEDEEFAQQTLLARYIAVRTGGKALTAEEAGEILDSAMDQRDEEKIPLPMYQSLEKRLNRMLH